MPSISRRVGEASGILSCQAQPRTHAPAGTTASAVRPRVLVGRKPSAVRPGKARHPRYPWPRLFFLLSILLFLSVPLRAAPEKHLAVYSTVANYSLPIVQRQGRDYIGLLELLEPLGTVSAKADGLHWRLRYKQHSRRVHRRQDPRPRPGTRCRPLRQFLMENGRGLVPSPPSIPFCPVFSVVRKFARGVCPLFIGNVATHFTASVARMTLLTWFFNSPHPSIPLSPRAWQTAPDFQP